MFNRASFASCIGADVDDSSIKLVEISLIQQRYRVENYVIVEKSAWPEHFIAAVYFSAQAVQKTLMMVPDSVVLTQTIMVSASLSAQERKAHVLLTMEKLAACSTQALQKNYHIDFQIMGIFGESPKNNDMLEILCAAVPHQTLAVMVQVFHNTTLHVSAIYLASQITMPLDIENTLEINHRRIHLAQWQKDAPLLKKACALAIQGLRREPPAVLNFLSQKTKAPNPSKIIIIIMSIVFATIYYYLYSSQPKPQPILEPVILPPPVSVLLPTPTMKPSLPAIPLYTETLNHFTLAGSIQQGNIVLGFVSVASVGLSENYRVVMGDSIGKERAQIIEISAHRIIAVAIQPERRYVIE